MIKTIIFIGGDGRTVEAAKTLEKAGFGVRLVGFEKYESGEAVKRESTDAETRKSGSVAVTKDIKDAGVETGTQRIDKTEIGLTEGVCVVLPTPCSKDGQTLFAPFAKETFQLSEVREMLRGIGLVVGGGAKKYFAEAVDLLEREDFKILNAVPSAEGAVAVAVTETDITLSGAKCVVVGFGKIGKRLSALLRAFGADVTATARKAADFAEARAAGIHIIQTKNVAAALAEADIVFNTVPYSVIGEKELRAAKETAVFIELASAPGGIDKAACGRRDRKYVSALGLPGRFSPKSAGRITAEAIKNIIEETYPI